MLRIKRVEKIIILLSILWNVLEFLDNVVYLNFIEIERDRRGKRRK